MAAVAAAAAATLTLAVQRTVNGPTLRTTVRRRIKFDPIDMQNHNVFVSLNAPPDFNVITKRHTTTFRYTGNKTSNKKSVVFSISPRNTCGGRQDKKLRH